MLYMHDVWENWFEGEENGYNVCHYHEWSKDDAIEILEQIPLLYITKELFSYIENDLEEIPRSLLQKIYQQAYLRNGPERVMLEYTAIITDGKDILVFDTMGYEIPIRKSRLVPRQEQIVYRLIDGKKPERFKWHQKRNLKEYHVLSLAPRYMIGLTRKERHLKHLLMIAIDQLRGASNKDEIKYWLTEWQPKHYEIVKAMDARTAWETLYKGLREGWSAAHEDLLNKMIKGQPFLEKMLQVEQLKP